MFFKKRFKYRCSCEYYEIFIGALSSLRQFLVTESHLKIMKNAFYFTLKVLLLLKIFKFLFWIFGHVNRVKHQKHFLLKNQAQNGVEILFPGPFLKNLNWAYLWINNLMFYIICFDGMPSWGLSKYIETKLKITCFYLK